MSDIRPSRVLVVGATGSIGRHVVATASRHGLAVRALARDVDRARNLLPDVEVVSGDLEDPDSLTAAVRDVDGVVFTHGSGSCAYESSGGSPPRCCRCGWSPTATAPGRSSASAWR
jgi:nucleoside-diphosphate-sugar epimerase